MPLPPPPRSRNPVAAKKTEEKKKKFTPRVRKVQCLPPRMIIHAVEGFGKTTLGAYSPNPILLMAAGETGYDTLVGVGSVPEIPTEIVESWQDGIEIIRSLALDPQGIETLVLDTGGGFERLCHHHVCEHEFDGDWSEKGFMSYHKGYDIAVHTWNTLLAALDRLQTKGIAVIMLAHCKVQNYKNPLGPDFDRYMPDMHHKTWGVTAKWADTILFGNFLTVMKKEKEAERRGKGKAIGGSDRVFYTVRRDSYDAKNRYQMPGEIWLPAEPTSNWDSISQHIPYYNQKG